MNVSQFINTSKSRAFNVHIKRSYFIGVSLTTKEIAAKDFKCLYCQYTSKEHSQKPGINTTSESYHVCCTKTGTLTLPNIISELITHIQYIKYHKRGIVVPFLLPDLCKINFNQVNNMPAIIIAKLDFLNPDGSVKDRIRLTSETSTKHKSNC